MTNFQKRVLEIIKDDYKTCSQIAWELGGSYGQMHVGKSLKSLYEKEMVNTYVTEFTNRKYISAL
ncbi:hypothetical protein [Changchengzhania lutea]|uniref:hypothetical protein n=1 Tax=Changchengzhania lutea TaxID=2049305 RepID=UPI00115DE174|nr:hypothetical protein [Changchengzhania lutea]